MKIAIVGIGCRYPGADTPHQFIENVLAGRRYFRQMPSERLPSADYQHDDPAHPDTTYCKVAAVLEGFKFNPAEFRIPQSTYLATDVAQWLALLTASEALRDADLKKIDNARTAVILGNSLAGETSRAQIMRYRWPYVERVIDELLDALNIHGPARAGMMKQIEQRYKEPFVPVDEDSLAGGLSNTIPGRICNYFDFKGGGYTVDGACSSSLLAIIHACNGLENGDFDVALAGGVDISLDPFEMVGFAKIGALSPGDIKVYDQRSSGFLPGEGCGVMVLKRLEDALADNDRIYASITGWGSSTDGKGGLTAPTVPGQMLAIERAYQKAGYTLGSVELIEGHGTGTPVGDKVELGAVARTLEQVADSDHRCGIGSIKSNIGHTKAAAGVAGLIKATLSVYHGVLPPTQGLQVPNDVFAGSAQLYPLTRGARWDSKQPRRAGVSSAGFGGINTHVTLEEVVDNANAPSPTALLPLLHSAQDSEVFFLAADSVAALQALVATVKDAAARIAQAELVDLAAHCAKLSGNKPVRLGIVADTPQTLLARLEQATTLLQTEGTSQADGIYFNRVARQRRTCFVFPGQGSQRLNAGETWRGRFGFVDKLWNGFDSTLAQALGAPLSSHVFRDAHKENATAQQAMRTALADTRVAQPAIVAGSIATAELLKHFGIEADLCLGHSLGEYSALWCAGAMTAAQTMDLVAKRGQAMGTTGDERGAMISIAAGPERVERLLRGATGYLTIANFNSPTQTVVSGDVDAVSALRAACQAAAIDSTVLPVSNAFHSRFMNGAEESMQAHIDRAELGPLKRMLISSSNARFVADQEEMRALLRTQITAPVDFVGAVETALAEQCDVFIEVGPGSVTSKLMRKIIGDRDALVFATDSANPETTTAELNALLAFSFANGVPVRTNRVFEGRFTRPIALPYAPSFIASPCEFPVGKLNLSLDQPLDLSNVALSATTSATAAPSEAAATPLAECTPASTLALLQRYIVSQFGYPLDMVHAGARLQDDLSLDSIKSVEVVAEGMAQVGVSGDPTTLVMLPLEQIAARLATAKAENDAGTGAAPARRVTADLPDWTRSFEIELIEQELEPALPAEARGWLVVDGGNPSLAATLRAALAADGHDARVASGPLDAASFAGVTGCLVVLDGTAPAAGAVVADDDLFAAPLLLLDAAQAFLRQQAGPPGGVFATLGLGDAAQRAAAGFVKTLSLENPALRVRHIDADPALGHERIADFVAAEVASSEGYAEAAYGADGVRKVPQLSLRPVTAMAALDGAPFSPGDVLVISGGAGGITAECALDIASRYQLRLALLGSTPLEGAAQRKPSLLKNLQRFTDAGITFRYYQCDLTDAAQVQGVMTAIAADLGPVSALMHAAGLNRAHRIDRLDPEQFVAVMKPKMLGMRNLLAAVDLARIKSVIAFSSIIAKSGMAGNADYAYANEWLNGVLKRIGTLHPHVRCLSFNFSVWAEVGMGVDSVSHLQHLGIDAIGLEDGVRHVAALLERQWPAVDLVVASRLGGLPTLRFETPALPRQRFLETVVSRQAGVELITEVQLHPELDRFLGDHDYLGSLLFPAVLGMEAMVQVACACVGTTPADTLVTLRDMEFHKPIVVPPEGRAIRVYAQVVAEEAGQRQLRVSIRSSVTNYESDYFVATCVLEDAAFPEVVNDTPWPAPLSVDPHAFLYGSVFFQGPMFRNIVSFHDLSSTRCLVKVRRPAGTLVFDPSAQYDTIFGSPEVRDCYLHAVQACVPQHRILPVGVERIVTRPGHGQHLFMTAQERYHVGNEYCYDLKVYDPDGFLVEELQGFRCRILESYGDAAILAQIQGIHDEAHQRALPQEEATGTA